MMPFGVKHLTIILVCVCILVESKQDCGWDVQKQGCPSYGTYEWSCLTRNKPCSLPFHLYHCARDYHNKEVYTEACALEKDCELGTEPQIWTRDLQGENGKVTCELCFGNRYNDIPSQSSAMFCQCPKEQPEYTEGNDLINCHVYTSDFDLKTKRQWSRCDARHNYMMLDKDFDSSGCSNNTSVECTYAEPCPEGQERLLNYSCVAVCSKGYRRPNTSDECIEESIPSINLPESTTYDVNPSSMTVNEISEQVESDNSFLPYTNTDATTAGLVSSVSVLLVFICIDVVVARINRWMKKTETLNRTMVGKVYYKPVANNDERTEIQIDNNSIAIKTGCMNCIKLTPLSTFKNDALKPGDHIRIQGQIPYLRPCYEHHAIVAEVDPAEISSDGKTAKVGVIDLIKHSNQRKSNNGLCVQERYLKVKGSFEVPCECIDIIDYRKRKFDRSETLARAREFLTNELQQNYHLLIRNCEHFAATCVNGDTNIGAAALNKSTSSQAVQLFWIVFYIISFVGQCIYFFFSWYYFPGKNMESILLHVCYFGFIPICVSSCYCYCLPYLRNICVRCMCAFYKEGVFKIFFSQIFFWLNVSVMLSLSISILAKVIVLVVIMLVESVTIYHTAYLFPVCLNYFEGGDHSQYLLSRGIPWLYRCCCK